MFYAELGFKDQECSCTAGNLRETRSMPVSAEASREAAPSQPTPPPSQVYGDAS